MEGAKRQGCARSDGSDRWHAAGNQGGAEILEDFLLLPAVTIVSFLPGSLLRGGVSVLGLRFALMFV